MKRMLVLLLICLLPVAALADEHASEVESGKTAEMTAPEEAMEEVAAEEPAAEESMAEEVATTEEQVEAVEIGPVDDDAQIYVIKKGDTLWGISKRFIKGFIDPSLFRFIKQVCTRLLMLLTDLSKCLKGPWSIVYSIIYNSL